MATKPPRSKAKLPADWSDYPRKRGYHPVSDALADSPTEQARHVVARVAFLNALLQDERVAALFEEWRTRTGLCAAAQEVASAFDALAAALGLAHRSQLPEADFSTIAPEKLGQLEALAGEANRADERFAGAIERDGQRAPKEEAVAFVRRLSLSWSWLAFELVESFYRDLFARAYGRVVERRYWAEPKTQAAPHVEVSFRTCSDEPLNEARERLRAMIREAEDQLLAGDSEDPPRGRLPKGKGQHIVEWARWFYRIRIRGESIRSLAIERHESEKHPSPFADCNCRPAIQHGVNEAERLLGLTAYHLK